MGGTVIRVMIGVVLGAAIGAIIGYLGKCAGRLPPDIQLLVRGYCWCDHRPADRTWHGRE